MKVLIADDDKRIRDTVKGILEKAGQYHPVIIILTAIYKGTKYQSEARLRYGVDAYLHKPLQEVELMNAIDRLAA